MKPNITAISLKSPSRGSGQNPYKHRTRRSSLQGPPNILKRCVALGQGWMPIFQTEGNENLRGVQTNYHELAQDVATLAELADAAGKPKTMITGMGLPPTPEHVDYLMENGVERMMLGLPHDSPEQAFETLETYADMIKQYR